MVEERQVELDGAAVSMAVKAGEDSTTRPETPAASLAVAAVEVMAHAMPVKVGSGAAVAEVMAQPVMVVVTVAATMLRVTLVKVAVVVVALAWAAVYS
jgi:hypothetical protein